MPAVRRTLVMFLLPALLLIGCDQRRIDKLEEGVATETDVRQQFGEPTMVTEKADGSKWLEYPRQPEGSTNYLIVIGSDGKMVSLRQLLTPENFAKVQPGMGQIEVRRLLGKPAKEQRFAMKPDEEVWDWRFIDRRVGEVRKVFSVTFDREHRVLTTATTEDSRDTHTGG